MKTKPVHQSGIGMLIFLLIALIFVTMGCSEEEQVSPRVETNEYLTSLPLWNDFSPYKADSIIEYEPNVAFDCETKSVRTTTPCSITRTPEDIVTFDPNSEIMYLGSLIQGKGYINGLGSMKSLPIYQRTPLNVSISFQMSDNSRTVEDPSLKTVKQAIGELIEAAHESGHVSGSSILFDKKTSYSLQQTALALGLSANYMAASVKTNLAWDHAREKQTVSAYFIQKMFTVSMGLPQRPGDLFSDEFTQELLDEQINKGRIGPDNLPVFISNIVYGRMMTLTMTSSYEATEMSAALEASYAAIEGSISAEHKKILENSSIRLVTIGGDAQTALNFLRTGQLGEFFKKDAPLTTAVPISYTLRNLRDNEIAKVSQTSEYEMEEYDPVDVTLTNDIAEWRNAVQSDMSMGIWETSQANMALADESESFQQNNRQIWMGKRITFDASNTGFPFTFYLESVEVDETTIYGLVWNDDEASWRETISIGDIDNLEDDDFEIGISEGNVYALAFNMIDNTDLGGEFLEVHAEDGTSECQIASITNSDARELGSGFIGILSPVPIKRIYFNEDAGGDDIGIKHFYFGYQTE